MSKKETQSLEKGPKSAPTLGYLQKVQIQGQEKVLQVFSHETVNGPSVLYTLYDPEQGCLLPCKYHSSELWVVSSEESGPAVVVTETVRTLAQNLLGYDLSKKGFGEMFPTDGLNRPEVLWQVFVDALHKANLLNERNKDLARQLSEAREELEADHLLRSAGLEESCVAEVTRRDEPQAMENFPKVDPGPANTQSDNPFAPGKFARIKPYNIIYEVNSYDKFIEDRIEAEEITLKLNTGPNPEDHVLVCESGETRPAGFTPDQLEPASAFRSSCDSE